MSEAEDVATKKQNTIEINVKSNKCEKNRLSGTEVKKDEKEDDTKTKNERTSDFSEIKDNVRNYKKEEDFMNPPAAEASISAEQQNGEPRRELPNGFPEHLKEALENNQIQLETVTSKHGPVQMITLGANNNVFMQSRTSDIHPIYTTKELPQYLQDSLAESLSSMSIQDDDNVDKTVEFIDYKDESLLPDLTALITKDLSEPYSVYTYRYFLHNWPSLSFLAYCDNQCVGAIVCKLDQHRKNIWRGYIAMLVVHKDFRRHKIGSKLVQKAIRRMVEQGCDEVVLETEVTNRAALNLYENLGFVRDKRLLRYYLNGVDAWRLKLWLV